MVSLGVGALGATESLPKWKISSCFNDGLERLLLLLGTTAGTYSVQARLREQYEGETENLPDVSLSQEKAST